jgi:hypothetical protein
LIHNKHTTGTFNNEQLILQKKIGFNRTWKIGVGEDVQPISPNVYSKTEIIIVTRNVKVSFTSRGRPVQELK